MSGHATQERFDDVVDNSKAPWVPRPAAGPWAGRRMPASLLQPPVLGEDGITARRGGYPHPLQEQLDALEYPAWQLAAAEPQPPQVSAPHPFLHSLGNALVCPAWQLPAVEPQPPPASLLCRGWM